MDVGPHTLLPADAQRTSVTTSLSGRPGRRVPDQSVQSSKRGSVHGSGQPERWGVHGTLLVYLVLITYRGVVCTVEYFRASVAT